MSQCSGNTPNDLLERPIGAQLTVAEPNESFFKIVSSVIITWNGVLSRMGSRWQTYSLQQGGVRSLNQCVNGRELRETANEEIAVRVAVHYEER